MVRPLGLALPDGPLWILLQAIHCWNSQLTADRHWADFCCFCLWPDSRKDCTKNPEVCPVPKAGRSNAQGCRPSAWAGSFTRKKRVVNLPHYQDVGCNRHVNTRMMAWIFRLRNLHLPREKSRKTYWKSIWDVDPNIHKVPTLPEIASPMKGLLTIGFH